MESQYLRICQECGHKQADRDPSTLKGRSLDRYLERQCERCKSIALDYGTTQTKEIER